MEPRTDYGVSTYLPLPKEERRGVGLALSGGGFRAALFHLGALRRLNELRLLTRIDTFTSASGGSVTAAQLARHTVEHPDAWRDRGAPIERFEEEIAAPLRDFCRHDVRTGAMLSRLFPWNWLASGAAAEALANRYAEGPAGRYRLSELPAEPRFVLCATDLRFRAQWVFDTGNRRIGSDPAGYAPLAPHWTLARAAAASGCFPIAFAAMPVPDEADRAPGSYDAPDRDRLRRGLQLSDGGLCDNMALEPIWRDHETVLVSDASPTFGYAPAAFGRLWDVLRYPVTVLEQGVDIRKRWLVASFVRGDLEGSYWGIASSPSSYGFDPLEYEQPLEAYPSDLIRDVISQVRIDFDAFSDGEIAVLENHGYLLAEIAVRRHAAELVAGSWPEPRVPHPEWMDEERVRTALRGSARSRVFSRR